MRNILWKHKKDGLLDWLIKVFYNTTPDDSEVILKELDDIDCEPEAFYKAAEILESGVWNTGFTYTDTDKHVTFVTINETDSAKEFLNTLAHEVTHIAMHIGEFYKLNYRSEDISYLVGEYYLWNVWFCKRIFMWTL